MRSVVLRKRLQKLMVATSVGALSIVVSACSSGFQRFDSSFYEDALPQKSSVAANPYPDNVDPITTASVGEGARPRLTPLANVAPKQDPAGVYHQPEPTHAAPRSTASVSAPSRQSFQNYTPTQHAPVVQAPAAHKPIAQAPRWSQSAKISSSQLSEVKAAPQSVDKPLYDQLERAVKSPAPVATSSYSPPKPEQDGDTVYIPHSNNTDAITTSAIAPTSPVAPVSAREEGWTGTGGTAITVRQGETLYNLSKRYGVPASEIRRVNNLASGSHLQAGQKIVIPNFVYGPGAAVSAPDNNPETRASTAGVGYLGEADVNSVVVPTRKPFLQAAVSPTGATEDHQQRRYQPKTHSAPPDEKNTPDYGVVTGSLDEKKNYIVQPGDTLSGISSRTGASVSALQQINGITGHTIRVGQTLNLPGSAYLPEQSEGFASNGTDPSAIHGVDPVVTGGVQQSVNKTQTTVTKARETVEKSATEIAKQSADVSAPAATGIESFRWPVNGRVIEKFGASNSGSANDGIDISVPAGTAVRAAENGVVIYAGDEISEYGKLILVRHSDDWVSAYAHNRDFEVKKGDQVSRGQIIARSGSTGDAEMPKLHFELRKHSRPVDPVKYLTGA